MRSAILKFIEKRNLPMIRSISLSVGWSVGCSYISAPIGVLVNFPGDSESRSVSECNSDM